MYLVLDGVEGMYIFVDEDPRKDGCPFPVIEGVELESVGAPGRWTPGTMQSELYLGRSPVAQNKYRIFNSAHDCHLAAYEPLGSNFQRLSRWSARKGEEFALSN